ncbi:aldehyde dehydrogenase family protein [Egicoccus sp. AB-alg2]|uniref:aldehyde dehydrogenase family protein n=1 Tax=Egicoccus sp. AB-alg2 TaxID=3242693 RepID=UPI00359D511A
MEVISPIDGAVFATVGEHTVADAERALATAAAAQPAWAATAAGERGRLLHRVADLIRRDRESLAELESRNTGKLLADTRREVERAADCFTYYAGWADKVLGRTIPVPGDFHTYTERVPFGVALGIIPWNVPLFFAAKKMAPALAFGNATVVKPAPETPLTAMALRDLVIEAGIDEDLVHVVVGGREVGAALVTSPDSHLVVVTGHPDTGRAIARAAADTLTPVGLELGGKSPQLVFTDADLDAAADAISLGVFATAGQMCIAGSRLLVHEQVHEPLLERLADRVTRLRVGDPFSPDSDLGPQITSAQRDKTLSFIEGAAGEGARLVGQASLPDDPRLADGYFVPPSLFDQVHPDSTLAQEEVFGPVLGITTFRDEADAVRLANHTRFGLAAGVWTSDVGRAHAISRQLRVGNVWINTYRVLSDLVPFGGFGDSGYGRENGEDAVNLYTTTRATWTSLRAGVPTLFSQARSQ